MYTLDRDSGTVVDAVDVDACVVDVDACVDDADAAAETDESIPGGLFRISQWPCLSTASWTLDGDSWSIEWLIDLYKIDGLISSLIDNIID